MPLETKIALQPHAERGLPLSVGSYSYGTPALFYDLGDTARLTIGRFCSIADGVKIFVGRFGRHHYDFLSTYPMGMVFGNPSKLDVSIMHAGDLGVDIGSDVWLARDCTIMAGVKIGHGAVVGASSLVVRDVEPYEIVGGVPAKPLKKRFSAEQIERLLRIQWWNWTEDKLRSNIDCFYRAEIEAVLKQMESQR
jgi:chloramphenicol O-acetyltransferase type B